MFNAFSLVLEVLVKIMKLSDMKTIFEIEKLHKVFLELMHCKHRVLDSLCMLQIKLFHEDISKRIIELFVFGQNIHGCSVCFYDKL